MTKRACADSVPKEDERSKSQRSDLGPRRQLNEMAVGQRPCSPPKQKNGHPDTKSQSHSVRISQIWLAQGKEATILRMLCCKEYKRDTGQPEPIRLRWDANEKTKTKTHRKIAGRLLCTTMAVKSRVLSVSEDVHAFSTSLLGALDAETQIMVFECAASEGATAFLRLCSVCKWMHFLIRSFMHATLQEQACRLACSNTSLLPVSTAGSYTKQFAMEMRGSLALRLIKKAFSMLALHCASPHCSLVMRAYNQALVNDLRDPNKYPQLHKASMVLYNNLESTGVIRVAYHKSELLAAAHDTPAAFVLTEGHLDSLSNKCVIVRVDAGQAKTVWSPHSEMAVSEIVNAEASPDAFVRVLWMSASHDGTALLYAVSVGVDDAVQDPHLLPVKTYLWDMYSQASYPIRFVSMIGESGLPVEPSNHGWKSLGGWFRKTNKGPATKDCLNFAVVFQTEDWPDGETSTMVTRHSIWQYGFVRCKGELVCHQVGLEASEMLGSDAHLSVISSDVSGRWMGCRVGRLTRQQSFGCMIDIDSHVDGVIFCCPKALLGGRFGVRKVTVSPAGDKLAMMCRGEHQASVEVHKRISDSACVRLMHVPLNPSIGDVGEDDPLLRILTFSPCGRFLVWRESEVWNEGLEGLMSMAITEDAADHRDSVAISRLNAVRQNMPRDLCWRQCGVWMRLRRGAVLVQS